MTYSTFGFEAEFENNVEAVLSSLVDRDLAGDRSLHGYHCRCDTCDFDSEAPYPFRGQSDSSCGGEIISGVCEDIDADGREWMLQLEQAAVEADAEPSLRAGFHVHVGVHHMSNAFGAATGRERAVWNYLRWEHLLADIAQGRWEGVRGFNLPLQSALKDYDCGLYEILRRHGLESDGVPWQTRDSYGDVVAYHPFDMAWVEAQCADAYGLDDDMRRWAYRLAWEYIDRHSWLNVRTRNERTLEFRLWNSTRSAWRMETFVRTSLLFVNPEATDDLATKPVQMRSFLSLAERHDPGLKALLKRQLDSPKTSGPLTVMAAA